MKKLTILSGIIIVLNLQTVCGMESDTNDTDLLHLIAQDSDANTKQNQTAEKYRFLCEHPGCHFAARNTSQLKAHRLTHTSGKSWTFHPYESNMNKKKQELLHARNGNNLVFHYEYFNNQKPSRNKMMLLKNILN